MEKSLIRRYNSSDLTIIIMTNKKHSNLQYLSEEVTKIVN